MSFPANITSIFEGRHYADRPAPGRSLLAGLATFLSGFLIAAVAMGLYIGAGEQPPTPSRHREEYSVLARVSFMCLISPVIENLLLLLGARAVQLLGALASRGLWAIRFKAAALAIVCMLFHFPLAGSLAFGVIPAFYLVSSILLFAFEGGNHIGMAYLNTVIIHSAHNAFVLLCLTLLGAL